MDWFISNLVGGIKLCVRPEDADAAVELLDQPIPADFDVEGVGPFQQPACPHCESLDVSYETLHKPVAYASGMDRRAPPCPAHTLEVSGLPRRMAGRSRSRQMR